VLLFGLENDQDFEYLNSRRCPASGSDQGLDLDLANHVVVKSLYMPHSIMVHQNKLSYCDSMSFSVITGNEAPIQLAGFTRGLAITDDTIFIGQSRMRRVLRIPHDSSNCCLDGGIYIYNPEFRISRFVSLPSQQVYQILVLDPDFSLKGGN
jgi:hypothetical protein